MSKKIHATAKGTLSENTINLDKSLYQMVTRNILY